MLVSFTIFDKGGRVLFQHSDEASGEDDDSRSLSINTWLEEIYFNPTVSKTLHKNQILVDGTTRQVVEWEETSELIALAVYPDLRHEDSPWIRSLLAASLQEYQVFARARSAGTGEDKENSNATNVFQGPAAASPESHTLGT